MIKNHEQAILSIESYEFPTENVNKPLQTEALRGPFGPWACAWLPTWESMHV